MVVAKEVQARQHPSQQVWSLLLTEIPLAMGMRLNGAVINVHCYAPCYAPSVETNELVSSLAAVYI